jgi:membrane protein
MSVFNRWSLAGVGSVQLTRLAFGIARRYPLAVGLAALAYLAFSPRRRSPPWPRSQQELPRHSVEAAPESHSESASRGRSATTPSEIPASGWRDILMRVKAEIGSDHVSLVAAGLALYALLAVFPGLAASIAIYGIFTSPGEVIEQMQTFSAILPPGTWELFSEQLHTIASQATGTLTFAAIIGFLVALWGARAGMASLMIATNIAYAEAEKRGFVKQTLTSVVFTLAAILGFLLVLALGVVVPLALEALGTSRWVQLLVGGLRWVVLWAIAVLGLAVLYRYAPSRKAARWRWVTSGSAIAATLWLLLSAGFAFYVGTFASYGKTYGALGGVIALLMWFYLSSFAIVIGAEINAEMERQTRRDTTEGPEKPMGQRGAFAADTLGPVAGDAKNPKPRGNRRPTLSEHAR